MEGEVEEEEVAVQVVGEGSERRVACGYLWHRDPTLSDYITSAALGVLYRARQLRGRICSEADVSDAIVAFAIPCPSPTGLR